MSTENNWTDDKLGRSEVARYLTHFVENEFQRNTKEEAYVISLNAPWGFGKTFFLKNWMKDLKKQKHFVVYFDAWKTDISNQPLVTFLAEFHTQLFEQLTDVNRTRAKFTGAKKEVGNSILPIMKGVLKHHTGIDVDELSFEGLMKEYTAKINAIKKFENAVDKFCELIVKEESKNLPIYVLIDEMDRCRPNYAIELLENIKHLFSTNNLCFVVSSDTEQLSESIKVIYGAGFDSGRYLHRFFDQEYRLPEPNNESLAKYLFDKDPIKNESLFNPLREDKSVLFAKLAHLNKLSIREQIKSYNLLRILTSEGSGETIDILFALALIMMRLSSKNDFVKIKNSFSGGQLKELYETGDFDTNVEVDVMVSRKPHGSSIVTKKIYEIVCHYFNYININLCNSPESIYSKQSHDVYRKIQQRIIAQIPHGYTIGEIIYPDIHEYLERINQVGQIVE